jgi:hypothetical protein
MNRLLVTCLFCSLCVSGKATRPLDGGAKWVSCFADPPDDIWRGPKTVRTRTIKSSDGRLRAYAKIEAQAGGKAGCHNTVRLFVWSGPRPSFHQVFMQQASDLGGTANSLGVIGWSPDGRWLLVERGKWFYASDAGGLDVLLYDARNRKITLPNLRQMLKRALKQDCDLRVGEGMTFDAFSRVHLQLADSVEEGEDTSQTHWFRGSEEWVFSPSTGTMRPNVTGR